MTSVMYEERSEYLPYLTMTRDFFGMNVPIQIPGCIAFKDEGDATASRYVVAMIAEP